LMPPSTSRSTRRIDKQMNQRAPFYVNQIVKGSKPADPPRSATFCCAA
jgi:hypothetical protein